MLDFDRLRSRFAQFGVWRLVWQYARMGVLWTGVMALIRCALKGVSMKAAYPVITRKVDERLILRYRHILDDNKRRLLKERSEGDGLMADDGGLDGCAVPKIVWFSWLQGLDKAPEIVRVCLASQRRHLPGYEFRTLDLDNYRQWVELLDYVVEKYRKGLIPQASFSDLLRLAVLKRYAASGWMLRSFALASETRSLRHGGTGSCGASLWSFAISDVKRRRLWACLIGSLLLCLTR